ncbi:uncharacterized protein LOC131440141 [Malaya genurostris]|uniref:uncharacterized protein LOC131440141 n=1 Tax=Malaya genurostris TaxID=325434 RepID=UPI0026F3BC59|nr:uncharacterized protein LOC131440141 [Malaya genurostris]
MEECQNLQTSTKDEKSAISPTEPTASNKRTKYSSKTSLFGIRKLKSNFSTQNVRRLSTDSMINGRLDTIGRRLSGDINLSSPDPNRNFETFGKRENGNRYDTYSGKESRATNKESKYDTLSGKIENYASNDVKLSDLGRKNRKHSRRTLLKLETSVKFKKHEREDDHRLIPIHERVALGLAPPCIMNDTSSALLRDQLHEELRLKYSSFEFNRSKGNSNEHKKALSHCQDRKANDIVCKLQE